MGIIAKKIDEKIHNQELRKCRDTSGYIIAVDNTSNTCTISFQNPNGDDTLRRSNVPVSSQVGAMSSNGIKPGCKCNISFNNGNIYAPVVTGIFDSFYNQKTCSDEGCILIDDLMRDFKIPNETVPMCNQWINKDLEYESSNFQLRDGEDLASDVNVDKEVFNMLSAIDKYTDTEAGITNLDTKSTIKLKDNGDIDFFVGDNVGIRINKKTHKIYLYGGLVVNGEDYIPFHECNTYININNGLQGGNSNGTMNNKEEEFEPLNLDIEELKRCIARTGEITGDPNAFNSLNAMIELFEDMYSKYNNKEYLKKGTGANLSAKKKILSYYDYFINKELAQGRKQWGLD